MPLSEAFRAGMPRDPGFARLISFCRPLGYIDHSVSRGGTDGRERGKLHEAIDREQAVRVRDRMWLVCLVPGLEMSRKDACRILRKRARRVRKWPRRYREGGLAALSDLPRSGRPPAVPHRALHRIMGKMARVLVTPGMARPVIADASGVAHRVATVRRLMRASGLSPKVARLARVNRAGRRAVAAWRWRTRRRIARPRRRGLAVVVQDGPVFVHDAVAGVKHWSPVGVPADVPHAGSHSRVVVYGAIAEDGRRPSRTHEKSSAPTFVGYLRGPRRKFGRVAAMPGRAPLHTARPVRAFLRACGGEVVLIKLPVGSPCPSVVRRRGAAQSGRFSTRSTTRRARPSGRR